MQQVRRDKLQADIAVVDCKGEWAIDVDRLRYLLHTAAPSIQYVKFCCKANPASDRVTRRMPLQRCLEQFTTWTATGSECVFASDVPNLDTALLNIGGGGTVLVHCALVWSLHLLDLRRELRNRGDTYRSVLFLFGDQTRYVTRASLAHYLQCAILDNVRHVFPECIPVDKLVICGIRETAPTDVAPGCWWSDKPTETLSLDAYTRASIHFIKDLRSSRPLGGDVNRAGLWFCLRGLAASGKRAAVNDLLHRFHAALLYDLKRGAHRFSTIRERALLAVPGCQVLSTLDQAGAASMQVRIIDSDTPLITQNLRDMFPTDTRFVALPLEQIGLVQQHVATGALCIQAGWLMAPFRLLSPCVAASLTIQKLRRACSGWLDQHKALQTKAYGQEHVLAAERGVKRVFSKPIVQDVVPLTLDAMYTSTRARVADDTFQVASRTPCASLYLTRATAGEKDAKLQHDQRWGVIRTLHQIGVPRAEIEAAYISEEGLRRWYTPDDRIGQRKERQKDMETFYSRYSKDAKFTSCQTMVSAGLCAYIGDIEDRISACCSRELGRALPIGVEPRDRNGRPVFSPVQIARLRGSSVRYNAPSDVDEPANLLFFESGPARIAIVRHSRLE